ncbi:MAG: pantoate--beta-alanine ligase [Acidobacteriota bacterium]|nr:pantoate--beta-alanine ligase [Acidobacteriota bacterium]
MILCTSAAEMSSACRDLRASGLTLGLVPTMGALHAGHMSLVSAARADCDHVAASIFVNPTQFGPNEDLASYPRTFDADRCRLEDAGVDLLFAPSATEMYPPGNTTFVDPGDIANRLDGATRPGHFRGVATIVTRLFNIVGPDRAYFGQKDAAQIAVLRHMVRDLNLQVHIAVCPIVREPDGLALSSRNRYLSPAERKNATVLIRSLRAAEELARAGETSAETLRNAILAFFPSEPDLRLDYAVVVDPDTLLPVADATNGALVAVAAFFGTTRLIDNLLLHRSE